MMSRDPNSSKRNIIEARNVFKSFGDLEVLKDVSLDIAKQETMVIVGPSGSGKSTLIRCFNLLEGIQSGEIRFEGNIIKNMNDAMNVLIKFLFFIFYQLSCNQLSFYWVFHKFFYQFWIGFLNSS